ncbi:MAG: hypothetical protein RLZZ127_1869 [Planctomycetota bacterium]|jgi:hypothetical protein
MMHPDTRLQWISDAVGHGVVATRPIPAGTIVWAPDPLDRRIGPAEFAALPDLVKAEVEHFAYADQDGCRVLAWDRARYVNHSCAPTCVSGGYDCNVAAVDLAPGDELTDDYGSYLPHRMACACGAPGCRGTVARDLAGPLIAGWDARFRAVFPRIAAVPQPLWPLLSGRDRTRLQAALAGREPVASIRDLIGTLPA